MTNNEKKHMKTSAIPLGQQISNEGYNLKIKNQSPPPRPTTPPVNTKKS